MHASGKETVDVQFGMRRAMNRFGYVLMFTGILVLMLGMGQLAWLLFTSPDPHPNPAGSGMPHTVRFC